MRPFPGPGEARQVSAGGGTGARWRADGSELFYLTLEAVLMAVDVRPGNGLSIAPPRSLFRANLRWVGSAPYDVAPDGQSFVIIETLPDETAQPIALVIDWTAARVRE